MAVQDNALTTLANVKAMLQIPTLDTSDDAFLEGLIDRASDICEELTDRKIKDYAAITEFVQSIEDNKIYPLQYPINSVTSVAYNTGTFSAPIWTAVTVDTGYDVDPYSNLINLYGTYGPTTKFQIVYRGGYTTVPKGIVQACEIIVGMFYNTRNSHGATNESVGGASVAWDAEIPKKAEQLLAPFKRYVF